MTNIIALSNVLHFSIYLKLDGSNTIFMNRKHKSFSRVYFWQECVVFVSVKLLFWSNKRKWSLLYSGWFDPRVLLLASQPLQPTAAACRGTHTDTHTQASHGNLGRLSPVVEDAWSDRGGGRDIASLLLGNRFLSTGRGALWSAGDAGAASEVSAGLGTLYGGDK